MFHIKYNPPKLQGICNKCGGELIQREDDSNEEAIKQRLALFFEKTLPLIDYYKNQGILEVINGDQPISIVSRDIINVLKTRFHK